MFGIATCYAEAFLSSKDHIKNEEGQYTGGPMYVLKNILHMKFTANAFALFAALASFGIGSSVQANSICAAVTEHFTISPHILGMVTAITAGFVVLGGVKQIVKFCTWLVPFMSIFYLLGCVYLLVLNRNFVPDAILVIIQSAFSSKSFIGGIAGTAVTLQLVWGLSDLLNSLMAIPNLICLWLLRNKISYYDNP